MNKKGLSGLLILFAVLTAIFAFTLYYSYQLPTQQSQTLTTGVYQETASYDYTAYLIANNTFYDNGTMLKPGDGLIYENLLQEMNVTFSYSLNANPAVTSQDIGYILFVQVESPGKWVKPLTPTETTDLLNLTNGYDFSLVFNATLFNELVKTLDNEAGTSSPTYDVAIQPIILVNATTTAGNILDTFAPKLLIIYNFNVNGSYISVDLQNATKSGAFTKTVQIPQPNVQNLRNEAVIALVSAASLMALSSGLYLRSPSPIPSKQKITRKIVGPFKDISSETSQDPPETKNTVEMKSIKDLAKTAEMLARPMLYFVKDDENVFYVIDNDTKYIFRHTTKIDKVVK